MKKDVSISVDYFSRICILLINDGTDALRWFLEEHLPLNNDGTTLTFKQVCNTLYSFFCVIIVYV